MSFNFMSSLRFNAISRLQYNVRSYFGGYPEGVSYAILCMNCCVVLLDRIGRPVKFGAPKKEAAKS